MIIIIYFLYKLFKLKKLLYYLFKLKKIKIMESNNFSYPYEYEKQFVKILKKQPTDLQYQILAIKQLLMQRLKLENEYKHKYQEIQYKYSSQFKENYNKRNNIIKGDIELNPNDDIIKNNNINIPNNNEKGIPLFWYKCFDNSSQLKNYLNEKDRIILKNLSSILCEEESNGNFKIIFQFKEKDIKPFFSNNELYVHYILDEKLTIKEIESSIINWTNDISNPSIILEKKQIKNQKTGEIIEREEKTNCQSFFSIFKNIKKGINDKIDDEITDIYDLGYHIKEDLIPNSIEYYLNMMNTDIDFENNSDEDSFVDEDDF
jgi:hypothetical protein